MNNYDDLAQVYARTNKKPDKRHSILPTILSLAQPIHGRAVLDLGCGDGFFARRFLEAGASRVIGIDNSQEQIKRANSITSLSEWVEFRVSDIFLGALPQADILCAPFVLGYCASVADLLRFAHKVFHATLPSGRFVSVVDLPSGADLKKFGAVKSVAGALVDGAPMLITLFSGGVHGEPLCTLKATYYSPETIEHCFRQAGFREFTWHEPLISKEGLTVLGEAFWDGYIQNPELRYFTAKK